MKRIILIIFGVLCLVLGTIGTVLPVLPTVPFYLLSAYCFSRSSRRLHDWFLKTKLYEKHLRPFINEKGMTKKGKRRIIIITTLVLLCSFLLVWGLIFIQLFLILCWLIFFFVLVMKIKTLPELKEKLPNDDSGEIRETMIQ